MEKMKVTLIGSFRKDPDGLAKIFKYLSANYELLSPKSVDFIANDASFVKAEHEAAYSVHEIEERLLESIRKSDFVWLFSPSGYVGVSAAFEIGFAHAIGVPIYTDNELVDEMINTMVTKVVSQPSDIVHGVHRPGRGVSGLQRYYDKVSKRRGWSNESPRDTMLLLTEEMGELARAIRKTEGLKRDAGYEEVGLMDELADVQLYLVHLANGLGVNLAEAVTQKEIRNQKRYDKTK